MPSGGVSLMSPTNAKPKPNALVVSFTETGRDPRVLRHIRLLEERFELTVIGYGPQPKFLGTFLTLKAPMERSLANLLPLLVNYGLRLAALVLGLYSLYYLLDFRVVSAKGLVNGRRFDVIIANDFETAPFAAWLTSRSKGKFFVDAHEYTPDEFDGFLHRFFLSRYRLWLCTKVHKRAEYIVTVSEGLARKYSQILGNREIGVLWNTPPFQDLAPSKVDNQQIGIIHHGIAARIRRIENMIELAGLLDERFSVTFMLVGNDPKYFDELVELGAKYPNVFFVNPVPTLEIARFTNSFDVGLLLVPETTLNAEYALPNKFFEYIQARLAIAIGPSKEMRGIVSNYANGVVTDSISPSEMATKLNSLSGEDIQEFKDASHQAAQILNWDQASKTWISRILGKSLNS